MYLLRRNTKVSKHNALPTRGLQHLFLLPPRTFSITLSYITIIRPRVCESVAVYYYNFALKDYGDATMGKLLDMVKVVAFAVQEGRVAIHCHAGKSIFHVINLTQLYLSQLMVFRFRVRSAQVRKFSFIMLF